MPSNVGNKEKILTFRSGKSYNLKYGPFIYTYPLGASFQTFLPSMFCTLAQIWTITLHFILQSLAKTRL